MTIPMWMLLGFATWTLLLLMATVGVYRWVRILFSNVPIASFRCDQLEGEDWYRRGIRAHANCVENLPVFGAIVLVISTLGVDDPAVSYLSVIVLIARVCQSLVHVSHVQTNTFVAVRFAFFLVQLVCFLALIVIAACYGV
ncbi:MULTISPECIES: MAPEG family protein [Gammaproteobacteria]|uniref:MAPEG family protein n=1 Tax=Pseudomonas lini TaxID=163011 RepID=A0A423IDG0_9PSED|nr:MULTISPECIES: MAPEG family protein [Gammaproteobacteria]MBK5302186.1 MAPEG family protein [Bacillus sp. TH86]MBK5321955.1 MAPEG family protein [Bacillus sp. TH59]MBK5336905.1 MAPEG family protein [Bacillus sp. TH57]MBK5310967.1 MAPEG family protein [Pseudomonas sp. TH71]MBK5316452.1 MAPEG family protein [Erwinia sp. TH79]